MICICFPPVMLTSLHCGKLAETTPENGSISSVDFIEICFTQRTKHLILSIPLPGHPIK